MLRMDRMHPDQWYPPFLARLLPLPINGRWPCCPSEATIIQWINQDICNSVCATSAAKPTSSNGAPSTAHFYPDAQHSYVFEHALCSDFGIIHLLLRHAC